MVSGFLTSPCDHSRIFSGEASEIRIALNESGSLGFSKKLKMSRIGFFLLSLYETKLLLSNAPRGTRNLSLADETGLLLRRVVADLGLDELDVQAQGLELLDEDVEALRQTRLERVL